MIEKNNYRTVKRNQFKIVIFFKINIMYVNIFRGLIKIHSISNWLDVLQKINIRKLTNIFFSLHDGIWTKMNNKFQKNIPKTHFAERKNAEKLPLNVKNMNICFSSKRCFGFNHGVIFFHAQPLNSVILRITNKINFIVYFCFKFLPFTRSLTCTRWCKKKNRKSDNASKKWEHLTYWGAVHTICVNYHCIVL